MWHPPFGTLHRAHLVGRLQDRMREALRIELRQEFVDKIESLEAQLIASRGSFDEYRLTLQVTHSGTV